jgi:hypothetical protein
MRVASQNTFPFSFSEYLNLPLFMQKKALKVYEEISQEKTTAIKRMKQQ